MFNKILVPLDGSDLAEEIYPHVKTLAAAFGADVTLLHVSESLSQTAVDPLSWHIKKAEAEAYLREQADRLRNAGVAVETSVLDGPVAERIVAYADRQEADLIILSSHGQGGPSEWSVSHIAQKVLQRGITSVCLVPAGREGRGSNEPADEHCYRRILLPLDGSLRAECVLPVARILAEQGDSELLLVHVIAHPVLFSRTPATETEDSVREWLVKHNQGEAGRYFEKLAPRLAGRVRVALHAGDSVALALHQMARDEGVDLVLLSAHGQTAQSQWPYGSITSNFITNGSVPLLIVQDLPQPLRQPLDSGNERRLPLHGSALIGAAKHNWQTS